ncbi:MAG: hypothetical protein ACE5H1_03170 [Thermodesulfobacteriota bacterium]
MPKRIRYRKKSFGRILSAWLGIRHTSKKYILLYFLVLIILIFLFPSIMRFLTEFKKNYGRGYGYVPRDFERSERLGEAKNPLPFQPKGAWQYGENTEKKKERREPYH